MAVPEPPAAAPAARLSLAENVVLGLIAEGASHGFAVARVLQPDGEMGRVYALARPAVYRSIERLVDAGLVQALGVEPGNRGPKRTPLRVTDAGSAVLESWLARPVGHVRQMRTELLAKLALLHRLGRDPTPLVDAQLPPIRRIVEGLAAQEQRATGFDHTLALWRLRSGQAALRFLEDLRG